MLSVYRFLGPRRTKADFRMRILDCGLKSQNSGYRYRRRTAQACIIKRDSEFMKFVAGAGRRPLQIESLAQPSQRALSRALIRHVFTHDLLKTSCQQSTDRRALFGGQYPRFAEEGGI